MASIKDCNGIQGQISEYIDGVLPQEDTWKVKMHLSSCAVCAQVADDLTRTVSLLAALPAAEPSIDFDARLARRLADQVLTAPTPRLFDRIGAWWARPRVRPALASGLALAALTPVFFFLHPRTDITPTPVQSARLDQIYRDHLSAETDEAFGDPSSVLLVSSASASSSSALSGTPSPERDGVLR